MKMAGDNSWHGVFSCVAGPAMVRGYRPFGQAYSVARSRSPRMWTLFVADPCVAVGSRCLSARMNWRDVAHRTVQHTMNTKRKRHHNDRKPAYIQRLGVPLKCSCHGHHRMFLNPQDDITSFHEIHHTPEVPTSRSTLSTPIKYRKIFWSVQ